MPYKNREDKLKHNHSYYKGWYAVHGRNRADNYQEVILEWRAEHPERVRAMSKLNAAINTGKVVKPEFCEDCGRQTRLSGHHEDYSLPLKVIWLCASCHKLRHPTSKSLTFPISRVYTIEEVRDAI